MKINHDLSRLAVRWEAPTSQRMRDAVDQLSANRDTPRWSLWRLDGHDVSVEEPNCSIHFHPLHLSSMRHFRVCHTNERIWEIAAGADGKYDPNLLKATVERFRNVHLEQTRIALLEYTADGPYDADPDKLGIVRLESSWRTIEDPPGYLIRVFSSNARSSPATRYAFLINSHEPLNFREIVRVVGDEKGFTLAAAPGWSLYEYQERFDKRNPHHFMVGPFPSFDDVWERAERFRASALGRDINRLSISFAMAPDIYETMHGHLNELANEWEVDTYGSYADGIDPYTSEASQSPDGRFPVVSWSLEREILKGLYYQADIVPTPEGRFLEIHSNCGGMKKLLKEAEAATGVRFTPISELPS